MASYTVGPSERGAYEKTLVAATVDTVTFDGDKSRIEVHNAGPGSIYFTVDGSTPSVGSAAAWHVPASTVRDVPSPEGGSTVVKLVSSATPTYSVTGE